MRNRIYSIMLAAGMLLSSAFFITSSDIAYAEEHQNSGETSPALQISPTLKRLDLEPGETQSGEIAVQNKGGVPYSFKVYAAPYTVVGDHYEPNFSNETNYTQITRWIKFDVAKYTIAPVKVQQIKYVISAQLLFYVKNKNVISIICINTMFNVSVKQDSVYLSRHPVIHALRAGSQLTLFVKV